MQQDQAQAVPILQKILSGSQVHELKSRATYFVLCAKSLARSASNDQSNRAGTIGTRATDQGDPHACGSAG